MLLRPGALHLGLLAERLPPEMQATYSALAQSLGQAGRAIGPLLATNWYALAHEWLPGSAPNAAFLFGAVFAWIPSLYGLANLRLMYGTCTDLSKAQKAALLDGRTRML